MAYMNESIYNDYISYLNQGMSVKHALSKLNVPYSTMYDYIKRHIEKGKKEVLTEYHIIRRKDGVSIVLNGKTHKLKKEFVDDNHIFVDSLLTRHKLVLDDKELKRLGVLQYNQKIVKETKGDKNFVLKNGKAYYKKYELSIDLFNIVKAAKSKGKSTKITKFLDLLIQNPDKDVIRQLYPFLIHNDIEICNNGYILAYKSVTHNFMDWHTKSIKNEVNKYVEMDRKDVDPNPNNVCSNGLHVGSLKYIEQMYSSGIIIKCIVHPKDIVSVPNDYNGGKCRLCKYKVVGVHSKK